MSAWTLLYVVDYSSCGVRKLQSITKDFYNLCESTNALSQLLLTRLGIIKTELEGNNWQQHLCNLLIPVSYTWQQILWPKISPNPCWDEESLQYKEVKKSLSWLRILSTSTFVHSTFTQDYPILWAVFRVMMWTVLCKWKSLFSDSCCPSKLKNIEASAETGPWQDQQWCAAAGLPQSRPVFLSLCQGCEECRLLHHAPSPAPGTDKAGKCLGQQSTWKENYPWLSYLFYPFNSPGKPRQLLRRDGLKETTVGKETVTVPISLILLSIWNSPPVHCPDSFFPPMLLLLKARTIWAWLWGSKI